MKRRTNQGGSVVTFVLVGVILAVGLIGAVYVLNKHGEQVRSDQTIAANEKKQTENKSKSSSSSYSANQASTSSDSTNSSTASVNSAKLPASGNELSVGNLMAVFLLASTATAYILSRRTSLRSL